MEEEKAPASSVSNINSKMTTMKVYYSATKAKQKSALRSGKGTDQVPPIK